jgi:hypothetical protein
MNDNYASIEISEDWTKEQVARARLEAVRTYEEFNDDIARISEQIKVANEAFIESGQAVDRGWKQRAHIALKFKRRARHLVQMDIARLRDRALELAGFDSFQAVTLAMRTVLPAEQVQAVMDEYARLRNIP